MREIGIDPVNQPPCARAACLQAGAAMKDDHQIAAQSLGLFGLADAKASPAAPSGRLRHSQAMRT